MTTLTNPHHHPYAAAARLRAGRRPPLRHSRQRPQATNAPEGETIATRDGRQLVLRDIHPDDVVALQRGFSHLTPEEIRMRFLHPLTELPEPLAQRLCNLDPETEVAYVLVDPAPAEDPEIHAVARAHVDPVTLAAEFALVVQGRFAGQGLGTLLMRRLIDECAKRGAVEMWGDVLLENGAMLELCHDLGFKRQSHLRGDPGVARVTLELQA